MPQGAQGTQNAGTSTQGETQNTTTSTQAPENLTGLFSSPINTSSSRGESSAVADTSSSPPGAVAQERLSTEQEVERIGEGYGEQDVAAATGVSKEVMELRKRRLERFNSTPAPSSAGLALAGGDNPSKSRTADDEDQPQAN